MSMIVNFCKIIPSIKYHSGATMTWTMLVLYLGYGSRTWRVLNAVVLCYYFMVLVEY